MIAVAEINDLERLDRFRLLWKDMLARTPGASFFQSLEWLQTYWRCFGGEGKLKVLIISVAAKPIGIVPLVVRPAATALGEMRVLCYPLGDWGMFFGPLGPYPAATLSAATKYLQESRRDWDVIDLGHVDAERRDRGRTPNALAGRGFAPYTQVSRQADLVETIDDWLDYWRERPLALRRRYLTAEEIFSRKDNVELIRYRPLGTARNDSDPRWELFSAFEEMLKRTCCKAADHEEITLARELYVRAVWAGAADLNLLSVNGLPVAAALNVVRNGLVENIHLVSSGKWERHATVALIGRMLKDSFDRQDTSFLFSPADDPSGWETARVRSYHYTHFSRFVPRAQVLRLQRSMRRWFGAPESRQSAWPVQGGMFTRPFVPC